MRRPALLGVALLLALSGAAGWGAYHGLPDPLADAQSFLAPYEEVSRTPTEPDGSGESNEGRFERRAPFDDEEARVRALLPPSRGWSVTRLATKEGVRLAASAVGPSRLRQILARLPFLGAPKPGLGGHVLIILQSERTGGAETTRAHVLALWRPYPFRIPATPEEGKP